VGLRYSIRAVVGSTSE